MILESQPYIQNARSLTVLSGRCFCLCARMCRSEVRRQRRMALVDINVGLNVTTVRPRVHDLRSLDRLHRYPGVMPHQNCVLLLNRVKRIKFLVKQHGG
jgi:hypothetical protein